MRHIIIGAGPAGVVAAETLRKLKPKAQITIIGDEPGPPYARMAIPYLLNNRIEEPGAYLRKSPDHFKTCHIELIAGRVTRVQTNRKTVSLLNGTELAYDTLLIATGSSPAAPPIPGIDSPAVHPCWTLLDSRLIMKRAQPGAKAVLMGAGFIGCIILEALAARGVKLTVVEMEDRMVPRMLNAVAGNLLKQFCESKGIKILTSTRVEAVKSGRGAHPVSVKLDNGKSLGADLVITATGVRPNIDFLHDSGIRTDVGVLVNQHMASNIPEVYAAGDAAQGLDFSTGQYTVQAIQPTAADHGRIAASNMAGHPQAHRGSINMNVLDTMGLISCSFGSWMGVAGGDSAELVDPGRFRYLNLQFEDDRLVGASSLGLIEHIGVIRGLIQTRVHLKEWKEKLVQDPTRLMEAYLANTQAGGLNAGVI
jgi:NAD(P)H-nitrite reductase large subunit